MIVGEIYIQEQGEIRILQGLLVHPLIVVSFRTLRIKDLYRFMWIYSDLVRFLSEGRVPKNLYTCISLIQIINKTNISISNEQT